MTFSLFLSLLGMLPKVLSLLQSFANYVAAQEARGQGRDEAVAEGLRIASAQLETATKAEQEAAQSHAAHPQDDGGFDPDFERKE